MSENPQTGVFPAYHPVRARDGKAPPVIDGAGRHLSEVRLRNRKDGNVTSIIDDGSGPGGQPNQSRQQLIRKIQQKEGGLPVFFFDEPVPGYTIDFHGIDISPAVANDAIRASMAENIEARSTRAQQAVAEIVARQQVAAQRASAQAEVFQAQIDDVKQAAAAVAPVRRRKGAADGQADG